MGENARRRRRGVVLTARGLKKLRAARLAAGSAGHDGGKMTVADLSELSGLDDATVSRVFSGRSGVDRQTLALLCEALGTSLDAGDFSYTVTGASREADRSANGGDKIVVSIELLLEDDRVVSVVARTSS